MSVLMRLQRGVFFKALPLRQLGMAPERTAAFQAEVERLAEELEACAARPAALSPGACDRHETHRARACLAMAARRALQASELGAAHAEGLLVQAVGQGLGVQLSAEGEWEGAGNAATASNDWMMKLSLWMSRDREKMAQDLVERFRRDLGSAFEFERFEAAEHAPPSFRLGRCFYREFLHENGGAELTPIFWAEHAAMFRAVEGFEFVGDYRMAMSCDFLFHGKPVLED